MFHMLAKYALVDKVRRITWMDRPAPCRIVYAKIRNHPAKPLRSITHATIGYETEIESYRLAIHYTTGTIRGGWHRSFSHALRALYNFKKEYDARVIPAPRN